MNLGGKMVILKNIIITFLITSTVMVGGYSAINNYNPVYTINILNTYIENAVTGGRNDPSETVYKFVDAINQKDFNLALTYVDPRYEKAANVAAKIMEKFTKVNLKDIADLLPAWFDILKANGDYFDYKEDYRIIVNRVSKKYVDDNKAILNVEIIMEVTDQYGRIKQETITDDLEVEKFSDEWKLMVR